MTQFLLFFSLLLHGITFILLIYFYKQNTKQQDIEEMRKEIREVESIFESYLMEIRDENEKLLNILNENGKNVKDIPSNKMEGINVQVDEPIQMEEIFTFPHKKMEDVNHTEPYEYLPKKDTKAKIESEDLPEISQDDQIDAPSVQAQVLQLFKQGYKTEDIAKKLNMGKTEIDLIIKFYGKS
jgi:hypothetical protein